MGQPPIPANVTSLIRHFSDLRDGVHGGATSRRDKEARFAEEVDLLAPVATKALGEVNTYLLLDSGTVSATGLRRSADGGMSAAWELSWPEQRNVRVPRSSFTRISAPGSTIRTCAEQPLAIGL